jgi:DNA-binding LacI/PurR family transcriptional regulator
MVRLKDIAASVGVSVMTVSKALRDAPDVSSATRSRIQAVARQLGYVPDSTAQGLRTRKTRLLGLLVPACADPVHAESIAAIEQRAHELGFDLLLAQSLSQPEREELCIRKFLSRRVDGLLLVPAEQIATEVRIYQELLARRVPAVLLGHPPPFCSQFPVVAAAEAAGSQAATAHLLESGHRRIAFFAGPPGAGWAQQRFAGYRSGLRQYGLDVDDRLVFQAGRTVEEGARATEQMLDEGVDATAVQASTDLVAIGCIGDLIARGYRVPHDFSVTGFGDIPLARHFQIPLTTVSQPMARLGTCAVAALSQLMRQTPPTLYALPAPLVVRQSTGIPPATRRMEANA